MIDIEELIKQVVERLKKIDSEKIILFGSYAYDNPLEILLQLKQKTFK